VGRATGRNNKELGALQLLQGLFGTIGSAGRGLIAGTAGLPGDIESLVRMLPGLNEKTILPTTEEVSGALPKLPTAYRQPVAEGLGQMGAMTPGQVAKLGRAGKAGALALMDRALTPSRVAQAGAVKPRGGNWLKSEGTDYINELAGESSPAKLAELRHIMNDPNIGLNQEHVGNWVRGPLTKYIKSDLGTATDPLLKLADEGISTLPKEQLLNPPFWAKTNARESRKMSGLEQPELGGYAQGWSDLADGMVLPVEVGGMRTGYGSHWRDVSARPESGYFKDLVKREGEWLGKLPDESKVYQFSGDEAPYHLGFNKVVDALREGMDPGATLPPGLRLKPEDLQQMGMEKAVRYMNDVENFKKVEAERQAQKLAESMGKQGTLHKEYPTGHRWVELNKPEKLDEQMAVSIRNNGDGTFSPLGPDGKVVQKRDAMGGNLTDVIEMSPEDAYLGGMLANEGNAMQQCVGGYCYDVAKGNTKIFSLRDAKGQPHTTVEVDVDPTNPRHFNNADDYDAVLDAYQATGDKYDSFGHFLRTEMPEKFVPAVMQVKGKQNTAPKAEILPMIQDFIKSNKYTIYDDLHNTGLMDSSDIWGNDAFTVKELSKLRNNGLLDNLPQYLTPTEINELRSQAAKLPFTGQSPEVTKTIDNLFEREIHIPDWEQMPGPEDAFAHGGLVHGDDDFAIPGHF